MRMITLALLIILVLRLGGAMAAAALNGLDSAGFPLPGRAGLVTVWPGASGAALTPALVTFSGSDKKD